MTKPSKVTGRQPVMLRPSTFNTIVDLLQRPRDAGGEGDRRDSLRPGVVFVRNDSGGALAQFDVLGIDAPIVSPTDSESHFKQRVTFSGSTPDIDVHTGRFVVLQEPLPNGKIGRAVISGVTIARVNVSDGDDRFADIADADATKLQGGHRGAAQILWMDTPSEGVALAIVRLGIDDGEVVVKITGRAAGGGQYTGAILGESSTADGEGNLSMPEGLDVPDPNALVLSLYENGIADHLISLNSWVIGKVVGVTDEPSSPPRKIVAIDAPPSGVHFAVKCTNDGGTNGDNLNPATFTYTVTTLDGVELGSTMSPLMPRPTVGAVKVEGTYGVGFYDGTTFKLWSAGEVPDAEACATEESPGGG